MERFLSNMRVEEVCLQPNLLLPVVQFAVELAKKKGAEFADAAISLGREFSIDVEKSSIRSAEVSIGLSFSIRVYIKGGLGYVSADNIEGKDAIEDLVEKAVDLARLATPDPDFVSLPLPEDPEHRPLIFDEGVLSIGPDRLIGWLVDNIKDAQSVFPSVLISGGAGVSLSAAALSNSTGINIAQSSTNIHIGFFCVVCDGVSVGSFADHSAARFLKDIRPQGLARKVTLRARDYLKPRKVRTARTDLVLAPQATAAFLSSIASSANAESIQRKRSFLTGKLGQRIGPSIFTLRDDGLVDFGLASSGYDGEGARRIPVVIVDQGRFAGELHNSYTANKAKTVNTGHGLRSGGISHTNLQLKPGDRPSSDIIGELEDGIYLELGGLGVDPASGDISTNLDFAFKIEKGELAYPLANTMIAGNILEFLANVDAISSDYRYEPGNIFPTVRIRDVQISSAGA